MPSPSSPGISSVQLGSANPSTVTDADTHNRGEKRVADGMVTPKDAPATCVMAPMDASLAPALGMDVEQSKKVVAMSADPHPSAPALSSTWITDPLDDEKIYAFWLGTGAGILQLQPILISEGAWR